MKYHEVCVLLKEKGFEILRHCAGSHELWVSQFGSTILVSRSGLSDARSKQNFIHQLQKLK